MTLVCKELEKERTSCVKIDNFLIFPFFSHFSWYEMVVRSLASSASSPFPLSKLVFMLAKRVSEPLAKRIKTRALTNGAFKRWVVLPPANLYHFYDIKVRVRVLSLGRQKVTKVPEMDEEKAVDLGSQLAAELALMTVATAIAYNEFRKYSARENEKAEERNLGDFANEIERLQEGARLAEEPIAELEGQLRGIQTFLLKSAKE
jgi:hypothetical protein